MVPVGFGLTATAGTYFAGLSFVLRDSLQDEAGKASTLWLIGTGASLSLVLALTLFRSDASFLPPGVTPLSVAVASGIAYAISETADLLIYSPLRKRGYIRAAVASNVAGSFVDTVAFLAVAGFPIAAALPGQMLGKLAITLAAVAIVAGARLALPRQPVRA
jgi:uncharacterized PurR-regulated membrane protein YhhQ (DUF165 family)